VNGRESPKLRLLQTLLADERGDSREVARLVSELQVKYRKQTVRAPLVLDGTWDMLSSSVPDPRFPAPGLSFYSDGQFMYDGSIQNGGLFRAIAEREAADVRFGVHRSKISDGKLEVSVQVEVAPGLEKTLSYIAKLSPLSPTTLKRSLMSLDLPEPLGSLTPVIEAHDLVEVVYSDDDLLILRDEAGHSEILVQESASASVLRSSSSDFLDSVELWEPLPLALGH